MGREQVRDREIESQREKQRGGGRDRKREKETNREWNKTNYPNPTQANTNVHMLAEVGKMAPWFSNWVESAERVDKSLSRMSGKSWAAAASAVAAAGGVSGTDLSFRAQNEFPPRKETLEGLAREIVLEDSSAAKVAASSG